MDIGLKSMMGKNALKNYKMEQQPTGGNYNAFLKVITIIHIALMGGLTMVTIIISGIGSEELGALSFTQQPKEFLIPAGLIAAIVIGRFISTSVLKKLSANDSLQKKLGVNQTSHLIKIAPLEGIGFFSVFTYAETNNSFFLAILAIVFALLILMFPTKGKIENAIPTSAEDQVYFRNPEKPFDS